MVRMVCKLRPFKLSSQLVGLIEVDTLMSTLCLELLGMKYHV